MSLQLPALDRSAAAPIWFQIMRAIELAITTDVWKKGDKLPSEHELCVHFEVSRTSVREALKRLENSGIISRRQGRGAFVERTDSPWRWTLPGAPGLLGQYQKDGRSVLSSRIVHAGVERLPPWVAAVFQSTDPGEDGFVLERIRAVGSLTAVHVVDYLPKRFAGVLPNLRSPDDSLFASIQEVTRTRVSRVQRTIEAGTADRVLARLLEVEEGFPIVWVHALGFDQQGHPIDFSRAAVRTDRLRIQVDSGFDADGLGPEASSGGYPN